MEHEGPVTQPVLTSHELKRVGPSRGKQTFEVTSTRAPMDPRCNLDRADRDAGRNYGSFPPRAAGGSGRHGSGKPQAARPPKQHKPVGFDHDALLQSYKGALLTLTYTDGADETVKLVDNDRYTLIADTDDGRTLIFKSSISSILLQSKAAVN